MRHETIKFKHNGVDCYSKNVDLFEKKDENAINEQYFNWKESNSINEKFGCRRANAPEIITEGLTSCLFNWHRTNNKNINGLSYSSMDLIAIDKNGEGKTIQLKACSTDKKHKAGPTSFGPNSQFDKLIFMHIDCDTDTANWYELDASEYKNWKVNKKETLEDQQKSGKRPRLNILNNIYDSEIKPFYTYKFKK